MSSENLFFYDEKTCGFVKADYPKRDRVVHYLGIWVLCGVVLASVSVAVLSTFAGSPSELALKAENAELLRQLRKSDDKITDIQERVAELSTYDRNLYRSILGLEPISDEVRQAGVGGADIFSGFDVFSQSASSILRSLNQNLESLEFRLRVQERSFEEILKEYDSQEERLASLPVIKPTEGMLISGFGMRNHTIDKMLRMHEGVDCKADKGEPV